MKIQLILLVYLLSFTAGFSQSAELTTPPKTLKVLSWNIYMLPGIVPVKGRVDRAEAIGEVLSKGEYDVIVFQEAFHHGARKKILESLSAVYPYQSGPANLKALSYKTNSGLWIFSKYPIVSSHAMIFKNRSGIDAFSRKGALLTEINIDNNIVQVVGTHLQSSGPDWIRHSQCVEFYHRLLKPYYKDGVPQIICGDFNIAKNNDEVYHQMLQTLGAVDGEMSGELPFSYDRLHNDLQVDKGTKQDLIDYILIRNHDNHDEASDLTRRIRPLRKQWCREHNDLSDHYALEAELHIGNMSLARKD
jgi:sphingomyelin phosphodiesterase